jgi:Kef-type K+ transport system membrane component KefB
MELLYILLVILLVTRACGELAVRLSQPALVGELIGGVLLGIVVHQFDAALPVLSELSSNEVFSSITDLGVFFLMLLAGLEMHPKDLAKASGGALVVAVAGFLVPLAAGCALGWFYLPESDWKMAQVLFIGTALAITAIPLAVKVLLDMGQLETRAGRVIVSAAIFDDIFGLILLAILTALLGTGELPDTAGVLLLVGRIVLFFVITTVLGLWVLPYAAKLLRKFWVEELEFSALLIVALVFCVLAEALGLHFILGSFVAGLFFTGRTLGTKVYDEVSGKINAITTGFLAPVFFASIGLHLDLSALTEIPVFVIVLILLAMLSKFAGAGLAARSVGLKRSDAAGVGVAMSARGAVELIIADIALRAGLFDHPQPIPPIVKHLFSAIVIMAIVTSVFMPVGLRLFLTRPDRSPIDDE